MSIKIENTKVMGWEAAIRGMRNPMNSWEKSDSLFNIGHHGSKDIDTLVPYRTGYNINGEEYAAYADWAEDYAIGKNDLDLMMRLAKAGAEHRKFMRFINVCVDITGPLYWWKQADQYRIGVTTNSTSTMHKIAANEFTFEDFSCEHLINIYTLEQVIKDLNFWRNANLIKDNSEREEYISTRFDPKIVPSDLSRKDCWWQMIQLLPSSYNQKRTVMLNYEVLANIYRQRKGHKLDEWQTFREWIESLPYSELITLKEPEEPVWGASGL